MSKCLPLAAVVLALSVPLLPAQEGNGVGGAFIGHNVPALGSTFTITFGDHGLPGGAGWMTLSNGPGPTLIPGFGNVWGNLYDPNLLVLPVFLDGNGEGSMTANLPSDPAFVLIPPIYIYMAFLDPSLPAPSLTVSKTVRIQFDPQDSYRPTDQPMDQNRALHTATATGTTATDNRTRVLVAGGGPANLLAPVSSQSTEVYWPFLRSFQTGPTMSVARTAHRSIRLPNGLVLITGGIESSGAGTASCDLYDPDTNTIFPTGSMTTPRIAHGLILLPDGRVLATGGLTDYTDATNNLAARLNTVQDTAEIYDPATGTWTPVAATMDQPRIGHSQTYLSNGTILIAGGIIGGQNGGIWGSTQIPIVTRSCEVFDPVTETFDGSVGLLNQRRAFHGASNLGNGDVLVTGGLIDDNINGDTVTLNTCERFNGSTWTYVGWLPQQVAFHSQLVDPSTGDAIIHGGLTGTLSSPGARYLSGRHDGTTFTSGQDIGINPAIPGSATAAMGAHTATMLYDGSILLTGGMNGATPLSSAWIHYP